MGATERQPLPPFTAETARQKARLDIARSKLMQRTITTDDVTIREGRYRA